MNAERNTKQQIAGLLYGLAAGLSFSCFAWGIDSIQLALVHGAYPWVKFIAGLIVCLPLGGLVGWLTMLYKRNVFTTITWIGLGIIFSRMVLWNPLWMMPRIIGISNNALGNYLNYSETNVISETVWYGSIVIFLVAIGCGLFEKQQVKEYVYSGRQKDIFILLFICITFFGLAGGISDSLVNKKLRGPIQTIDQMIQFSMDIDSKNIPEEVALSMNLNEVNRYKDFLTEKRMLIPSSFQSSLDQVDVLVIFNGIWVKCTTFFSRVASCEQAIKMPWIKRTYLFNYFRLI